MIDNMKFILLIPPLLFVLSIYFRFKDNSFKLIRNKITLDENYTWAIPIKKIKEISLLLEEDPQWERELNQSILARQLHYTFLASCFVSIFIVGYIFRALS